MEYVNDMDPQYNVALDTILSEVKSGTADIKKVERIVKTMKQSLIKGVINVTTEDSNLEEHKSMNYILSEDIKIVESKKDLSKIKIVDRSEKATLITDLDYHLLKFLYEAKISREHIRLSLLSKKFKEAFPEKSHFLGHNNAVLGKSLKKLSIVSNFKKKNNLVYVKISSRKVNILAKSLGI